MLFVYNNHGEMKEMKECVYTCVGVVACLLIKYRTKGREGVDIS